MAASFKKAGQLPLSGFQLDFIVFTNLENLHAAPPGMRQIATNLRVSIGDFAGGKIFRSGLLVISMSGEYGKIRSNGSAEFGCVWAAACVSKIMFRERFLDCFAGREI